MDERARAFWDRYWPSQPPTTTAATMSQLLDRIKLEHLRGILPGHGSTLEVGCGSARLSCFLAQQGYRTVCLDFSWPALAAARANYAVGSTPGHFVAGDGLALPFPGERFDVVLSTGLLEHFQDPSPIVGEMARVLKAGGLFYADIVPRKFSLFRSLDWTRQIKRFLGGCRERPETFYERPFTQEEIRSLLEAAGLGEARVFAAGVMPPYLPVLSRSPRLREAQVRIVERTRTFWKRLDDTRLAEWLGFYYFAWGRKPFPHS
jgi:SAM-dependent methyltransferase